MSEIKEFIPVGGVLPDPEENAGKNWPFLGAEDEWEIVEPSGDWAQFSSPPERQDNDTNRRYPCVSISLAGCIEKYLNRMMVQDPSLRPLFDFLGLLDKDGNAEVSECFIAKGSGTIPERGNSQYAVYEFVRKNGFVGEKSWPSNLEMTLEGYYRTLTPEVRALGKKVLEYIGLNYKEAGDNPDHRQEGLKRSSLCGVVGGAFLGLGGETGAVLYRNSGTPSYNHQLQIRKQDRNVEIFNEVVPVIDRVEDSYDPLLKDYAGTYPFKYVKIIKLTLKKKLPMLYKKIGQPAICFKHWSEDSLIAFADGSIAGGDLFKSLFGVEKYSDLPRQDVEEWPYPIRYNLTTTGLISNF